jgi:hypothetical protein
MIFTKRNAIVGFVTLKALEKVRDRRRKREKRALRIAALVILGVVSVGLLAGVAAAIARRHNPGPSEAQATEPEVAHEESEAASPGNGRVSPEPTPAA